MKILITGAGALLGQEIFKSLKSSDFIVGFADPSHNAAGLYWSSNSHNIPLASDEAYIDSLISLINIESYDFLIPGTDVELPKLSKASQTIEALTGCKVIISNPDVIDIANDKYLTYQFLAAHNFNPPRSWLPEQINSSSIKDLPFPLVVKPRDGARSIGLSFVDSINDLQTAITATHRPVVQECIGSESDEYTAGSLCFNGESIPSIILKRTLRDGNTWIASVVNDSNLESFISNVSEKLNVYGPCNFQFRIDNNGFPRIFEINSRFSGTTYMRTLAGFNEVLWCLNYAVKGFLPRRPSLFKELTFLRHFSVTSVDSNLIS